MNKVTKTRSLDILALLGFKTKEQRAAMTNEDWNTFNAKYKEKYGVSFQEDLDKPEEEPPTGSEITAEMQQTVLTALSDAAEVTGEQPPATPPATEGAALVQAVIALNAATTTIKGLSATQEPPQPVAVVQASTELTKQTLAIVLGHSAHTATHVFGIENDYFKRGNWWNELAITGKEQEAMYRDEDALAFRGAFNNFAKDFSARLMEISENKQINLLDFNKMVLGESYMDYSNMNSKLGEYIVRRMDMIIAYLRTLESVSGIFPTVYNVQNKMTAPTAFFEELSQSFLSGHHFKGAVHFDGEIYHVDDVMFKFFFDNPKELEKQYIGYLNREGSNPMKWTLFEWCIVHFGTLLFNEQQRRKVVGHFAPRQGDFPQPAMLSSDGVLRAIQRVEDEYKVLPFTDLNIYDRSTIIDYFETFWEKVMAILPTTNGYRVYANKKHQPWYLKAYREKYGKDTDFKGVQDKIADLSPENIIWVPNMSMKDYKAWIAVPSNVETYELKQNEMYAFYFQQDLEQLIMASWWKEGAGVLAPGVQFKTLADLKKSKRLMQYIFTNYPVNELAADATTADGTVAFDFLTSANTAATAITDIENILVDRVYRVICGSTTNATKIAKSGNFSTIESNWTPTAVGDYIDLYAQLKEESTTVNGKTVKRVVPTGKFLELERRVTTP